PKPSRGHGQDAGLDLPTLRRVPIPAGSSAVIHTGWSIAGGLPAGTIGIVADRSGHAANHGVTVLGGVIDPGYTGEIKVVLFNSGNSSVVFNPGDRVAQLLIVYGLTGEETTERGGQGFGSTGTGLVRQAVSARAAVPE
ncbi:dUTP diphosphatase, partial [Rhizobium leguminosarum]|uniref:dUTP diphosphatase n=1 Tax=Rhizobium ruizarguesonis TaxID=2081791 RepID=UPI0013B8FB56|nr:dUTP diphosphatase [Rhizobium ruizarguesonis]